MIAKMDYYIVPLTVDEIAYKTEYQSSCEVSCRVTCLLKSAAFSVNSSGFSRLFLC